MPQYSKECKNSESFDGVTLPKEIAADWESMRAIRKQFWTDLQQLPLVQIERCRELLRALERGSVKGLIFAAGNTFCAANPNAALISLEQFKEPLERLPDELRSFPDASSIGRAAAILDMFPMQPEKALHLSRRVEEK